MLKLIAVFPFVILILLVGCSGGTLEGEMDTPLEYSQFSNQSINNYEYEQLISFLYEAEIMMRKPLEEATINSGGTKVFSEQFKTKNDLFEYYQAYLSNELADTLVRKVSNLSNSVDGRFLAINNDVDWFSIHDAKEETIKIVQHTTVQSVVEMDLKNDPNTRLQYTIMKDKFGKNPKIVQKTTSYN